MELMFFILFSFSLQSVCLVVGARSSIGMKSQDDYFLAGRGVGFFPLMMTFIATVVGGGLILGSAEEAYRYGWSVIFYPLGGTLGFILMGMGVGSKLANLPISTTAQIFEYAYRSPALKKIASMLSIATLFMILTAQIVSSNKFMISLGVDSKLLFIAFWSIIIVYTALGGLKAVVATDIIQATFFMFVFVLGFAWSWSTSETAVVSMANPTHDISDFEFSFSKLLGWLLMPLLFMVIQQDIGQRCFAAVKPKTVTKAALCAGIFTMIISIIPIYFGITAKSQGIALPEGASVLIETIRQTTNPYITALVACAILAAIISTADSIINALGSNLSLDFDYSFLGGPQLLVSRIMAVVIAVAGLLVSFYFDNIVDLLIFSYELSVSCLFVPTFIALFRRQGNALSAGLAITFGGASFIAFKIYPAPLPKEILSVLLSFAGFYLGEVLVWQGSSQEEAKAYE